MPRYTVTRRYRSFSDGQQWGPWEPGDAVDLDADRAAWVNRDAAGTLTPAGAASAAQEPPQEPAAGAEEPEPAPATRKPRPPRRNTG